MGKSWAERFLDQLERSEHDGLLRLNKLLDHWVKENSKDYDPGVTAEMAEKTRPFLKCLLEDNSGRSAEELDEIACKLSPGGMHNGGFLIRLVMNVMWDADPLLVAATIWWNWGGGKVGFQFLPDPATCGREDYECKAWSLIDRLDEALEGDPRRILTDDDRAFYESLPDRMTIYRGCCGIDAEQAAAGLCWTTRRDIATWFATAGGSEEPVLVTARIAKPQVRLAKASEFEIVTSPQKPRQLSCRLRKSDRGRPDMQWTPAAI